jgi:hypothetical protein
MQMISMCDESPTYLHHADELLHSAPPPFPIPLFFFSKIARYLRVAVWLWQFQTLGLFLSAFVRE